MIKVLQSEADKSDIQRRIVKVNDLKRRARHKREAGVMKEGKETGNRSMKERTAKC